MLTFHPDFVLVLELISSNPQFIVRIDKLDTSGKVTGNRLLLVQQSFFFIYSLNILLKLKFSFYLMILS